MRGSRRRVAGLASDRPQRRHTAPGWGRASRAHCNGGAARARGVGCGRRLRDVVVSTSRRGACTGSGGNGADTREEGAAAIPITSPQFAQGPSQLAAAMALPPGGGISLFCHGRVV
uniref:Uncharacterized protein n=1 Tax=Arundo donax TaxID=35708 RepID=A0A0A8ZNQ8_ARUDO